MTDHAPTTHRPVQPEPAEGPADDAAPNPTQLPVEPEFGQMLPPVEPEDPGVGKPHI